MLIWMCALHCEAKPVIDFYRLKKSTSTQPFDSYHNGQVACIVSGMGQKMADAVKQAAESFPGNNHHWINIGIAGHLTLPPGTAIMARTIKHPEFEASVSLKPPSIDGLTHLMIESHNQPNTDYREDAVYDMEAFHFIMAAKTLSPIEHCLCIKVISDNQHNPPTRDKALISRLIAPHIPTVHEYLRSNTLAL